MDGRHGCSLVCQDVLDCLWLSVLGHSSSQGATDAVCIVLCVTKIPGLQH